MDLVILIGLQGSGKSSFYRASFAGTHDWVSKDRFPNNRNPARRQRQLLEGALEAGRPVVVDNTNATRDDREALTALGRSCGARIIGYYFESRLADCLERNRRRAGKERVPDIALYATRQRLELPSLEEGFDQLFFVRLLGDSRFEVQDWDQGRGNDEAR
jgi:predicted kinase